MNLYLGIAAVGAGALLFVKPSSAAPIVSNASNPIGDIAGAQSGTSVPPINYSGDTDEATLRWRIQDSQANQRTLQIELSRSGLTDDQKAALESEFDSEVQRELLNQNLLENLHA